MTSGAPTEHRNERSNAVGHRFTRTRTVVAGQRHGCAPYPKYKTSGVEWLGDVPEHWKVASIKRYCRIVNGGTPSSIEPTFWNGSLKWITPEDLGRNKDRTISTTRRTLSRLGYANCSAQLVPSQSVVLSTRAPIGHVAIMAESSCTNQGCRFLVPIPSMMAPGFLYYAIRAQRAVLTALGKGTTFLELSAEDLGSFAIALPLLDEQRAIAAYLDRETAKIDALIGKTEMLVEQLKEQRTARVSRTVIRGLPPDECRKTGINPNPKLKPSGVEWLGDVPEHWKVRRGKSIMRPVDVRSVTGQEELLTVSATHGVVPRASPDVSVTMFKAESYVGYKLCWSGDLVINSLWAWAYGLGVARHHGIVSSAYGVYRLLPRYSAYANYIHHLVRSFAFNWELHTRSKGIWISRLQLTDESLLAASFPVPPSREQATIAEYLDRATRRTDNAIGLAGREIAFLREYRARLVSDAVTGKIDVRGVVAVSAGAEA